MTSLAWGSYLARGVSCFEAPVFGTMEREDPKHLYETTAAAIDAGFRHFDFAEHYLTQEPAGRALRDSRLHRDTFWVTTKIDGMPIGAYSDVRARVQSMLEKCGLSHFDLLLIHYPLQRGTDLRGDPSVLATPEAWHWFVDHAAEAWRNMAHLKRDGLARHVGVSNFYSQHLDVMVAHAASTGVPIFANEVFIDAAHPEHELVELMARRGIRALAYRPLAFIPNYGLLEGVSDALSAAARATGSRDERALVLRWLLSRGIAPISSSGNPEHVKVNCVSARGFNVDAAQSGLAAAAEQVEMIDMCGGCDEYAAAFRAMGAPSPT